MGKFLEGLGDELSLYVRQVAWLQATPRDDEKRALAEGAKADESKSRLDEFLEAGIVPSFPDNPAPWLTETLLEIGPLEVAGVGCDALSWRTLREWQAQMGVKLEPWQARMLRQLSSAYLLESQRARKKGCPPPWSTETREDRRALIADKVDRLLDALVAAPSRKKKKLRRKAK